MVQPLPGEASEPPKPAAAASPPPAAIAMVQPLPPVVEPKPVPRPVHVTTRRMTPAATRAMREDSVLARIVANLSIPASELGVEGPEHPTAAVGHAPANNASQHVLAEAKAKAERDREAAARAEAVSEAAAKPPVKDARTLAAERKAAAAKAAAEKKALAARKAEAEKRAQAEKEAAEERRIARANPERIWVQVAGGANEADLPKAWAAARAKAPTLFAGRHGYKMPLRATHRVLAGPFKTDAEARAFVNKLAKEGLSAFSVTSEAGQVVTRLDAK
jgi:flagellar biosynthesis GTPase FlhF